MHYKQSAIELNISFFNNEMVSKIESISGESYTTKNVVKKRNINNLISTALINQLFQFDSLYLKDILSSVYNEMKTNSISFRAYAKIHNEMVEINNISDNRFYGFLKLVFTDTFNNSYFDEIPLFDYNINQIEENIFKVVNKNKEIISQKKSQDGFKQWMDLPVVLSPYATGYFIHEIVGHLLEADVYKFSESILNETEINPKLTVYDTTIGYEKLIGLTDYDDEGVKLKPLTLMKNGNIQNIIAIDQSNSIDKKLYGFARRENYLKNSLPRMRGTFVKPYGNLSQTNIINQYKETIFVDRIYSGSCLYSTGDFFIIGDGFYMYKGEKINTICNLLVRSNIKNGLQNIDYIGNDFGVSACECGKMNNTVRVCIGGPTISLYHTTVEGVSYKNVK